MKKSFPFEFEKYIAGTAFFNRREKGAYVDLLCYEADKGHMTIQNIKDILNGDFDCWEKIKIKFIEENGFYYNRKLESVKQGKHKKTENEIIQDKEKNDLQLKEKKQKFYDDCKPFLEKYPKEMLRNFYNYWTEKNKSGTKLRFELERTFEINRRLITWSNNDKGFKKTEQPDILLTYKELIERFNKGEDVWNNYEKVQVGTEILWKKKIRKLILNQ
jgi:hypothetical protein